MTSSIASLSPQASERLHPELSGVVTLRDWTDRWPWLVVGTTLRADERGDYRLFGDAPVGECMARWARLIEDSGLAGAAHARQVHGRRVIHHASAQPGLYVAWEADGHMTGAAGLLLTVSLADCTPVFLVDPANRAVALLHAGWRGTASGILGRAVGELRRRYGSRPDGLHLYLGPAICGSCYEVGPEVHEELGLAIPDGNTPVDVRAVLLKQAAAIGIPAHATRVSELCSLCHQDAFFSHRGGDTGRHLGILGIRPEVS
jgi:YfiH family protein